MHEEIGPGKLQDDIMPSFKDISIQHGNIAVGPSLTEMKHRSCTLVKLKGI